MGEKIKFFLKWSFVFSVLTFWSYFVIMGSVIGSFSKGFNIPIYIKTSAGTEKASSEEAIEILFNNNFEIEEKKEIIPFDRCSLRASSGRFVLDGRILGYGNKLGFNVNSLGNGGGSLTEADGGDRFSMKFDIKDILETNSEKLVVNAEGKGRINLEELNFNDIEITFDKINSEVEITGSGDADFEISGMDASVADGCVVREEEFYLLEDKGKLPKKRSIDEVRSLLDSHPEFIDNYGGLERLYKDYWWIGIPGIIMS